MLTPPPPPPALRGGESDVSLLSHLAWNTTGLQGAVSSQQETRSPECSVLVSCSRFLLLELASLRPLDCLPSTQLSWACLGLSAFAGSCSCFNTTSVLFEKVGRSQPRCLDDVRSHSHVRRNTVLWTPLPFCGSQGIMLLYRDGNPWTFPLERASSRK